jgi:hypothetical protein
VLDGPFLGTVAVNAGLVTRGQLRGARFAQVYRDVYVPAVLPQTLALRSRCAQLLLPPDGALCGHSAAELLNARCSPPNAAAEMIAPRGEVGKRRGLIVRQQTLTPQEVQLVDGCRVTTAFRTAWDLGRRLRLTDAVVAVDALARVGRFRPESLLDGPPGARGCRQLRRAVELADPLAESAMETRLRLVLVLGGLPPPVCQYRVRDGSGHVLARVDMAYPRARLALEYDGRHHFDDLNSRRDRHRDLLLDELGWHTMRFTEDDVLVTPADTLRRVAARLNRSTPPVENEVVVIK